MGRNKLDIRGIKLFGMWLFVFLPFFALLVHVQENYGPGLVTWLVFAALWLPIPWDKQMEEPKNRWG